MIKQLKKHAIIYLPVINATFTNFDLKNDPEYQEIIDNLKQIGDLECLESNILLKTEDTQQNESTAQPNVSPYSQKEGNMEFNQIKKSFITNAIRQFSSENLKKLFDVNGNYIKEDWEEWIVKTSIELLSRSPSTVLYSCRVVPFHFSSKINFFLIELCKYEHEFKQRTI
jgi:hypothetical protein